ncbi:hypothetical protein BD289DRAFT_167842 [Coniella lustricola]|uniref:Uncharacterized protein n=1 Tax=Coniella lustricola TaxID=2025994 RepID=A0A2T2ZU74_9PEZI|nr:hypothetical protein BD289DRAFT_167842 [Coniella lustricola]
MAIMIRGTWEVKLTNGRAGLSVEVRVDSLGYAHGASRVSMFNPHLRTSNQTRPKTAPPRCHLNVSSSWLGPVADSTATTRDPNLGMDMLFLGPPALPGSPARSAGEAKHVPMRPGQDAKLALTCTSCCSRGSRTAAGDGLASWTAINRRWTGGGGGGGGGSSGATKSEQGNQTLNALSLSLSLSSPVFSVIIVSLFCLMVTLGFLLLSAPVSTRSTGERCLGNPRRGFNALPWTVVLTGMPLQTTVLSHQNTCASRCTA